MCGKDFSRKEHRNSHLKCHGSEKKLICGLCGASLTYDFTFVRHCKFQHPLEYAALKACDKKADSLT